MDLQTLLDQKGMTKYRLSKESGVPNTTVLDLCAGRSSIERCSAKTVHLLSEALGCTMEDLLALDAPDERYGEDGLPTDKGYLECGLPAYLQESIKSMQEAWDLLDKGDEKMRDRWDAPWCCLQSDINNAEVNGAISSEQAWHLREKYLRMERPGDIE